MKDFQVQTIRNGEVIDTRPAAALFDCSLKNGMGPVASGYIINQAGKRVAVFETGRTWCKINCFHVRNRNVRPDGTPRKGPEIKRPFGVLWDNKHASCFGSFKAMLTAMSSRTRKN